MSSGTNSITAVLTDHGTVISQKIFDRNKDKFGVTKYIKFKNLTFNYPQFKKVGMGGKLIYRVPRGIVDYSDTVYREEPEEMNNSDVQLAITLHDYQVPIVDNIIEVLNERFCYLLQMDAGLGKTFVAAGVIARLKVKTCIIVSNKILRQQMIDDLNVAFNNEIPLSKSKESIEDINIIVINTALKLPPSYWKQFGLVIMDEVHSYCSDKFMEIFFHADYSKYVLGMTATPERLDSMESVIKLHLGPVRSAELLYSQLESCKPSKFYGRAIKINYYGPDNYTKTIVNKNGIMSPVLMAKQSLQDPIRMTISARFICDLYDSGRNIYVFCQTKAPLKLLRRKIIKMAGRSDEYNKKIKNDTYIVTGDSTTDESNEARSEARIFLTTYSLSSKGLSLPRFDTLIFLTSMKSNMTQIVGRIFRKGSDESIQRLIIDIVDIRTKIKNQWYGRKKEYLSRGLMIEEADIKWNELSSATMNRVLNTINSYQLRDRTIMKELSIKRKKGMIYKSDIIDVVSNIDYDKLINEVSMNSDELSKIDDDIEYNTEIDTEADNYDEYCDDQYYND